MGSIAFASAAWTKHLRTLTSCDPEKIHGLFLRWNQESLLIASHDAEAAMKRLGVRELSPLRAYLRGCSPSPAQLPDEQFTDTYRKSGKCLEDMLKAAGARTTKKGDQTLHKTILQMENVKYRQPMDESRFSVRELEKGL